MTTITQEIRKSTTWSIVLSVLMMVSGVVAVLVPHIAGLTVTLVFGWLLILTGVLHLGFAWRGERGAAMAGEILLALLYGSIGTYMLARPVAGLASLTLTIAVYLAAKGLVEGALAFKLRALPGSGWLLFNGILSVVIAAMIGSAWPASAAWAVGVLIGAALFSSGLARLNVSVAVRSALPQARVAA